MRNKFTDVVRGRNLEAMYPPGRLDQVADLVVRSVDFDQVLSDGGWVGGRAGGWVGC